MTRVTKTAKKFEFTRETYDDPFTLIQKDEDTLFVPKVKRFALFSIPDQLALEPVMDDLLYFAFEHPKGTTFTLGVDDKTGIAFIHINAKKFKDYKTSFFVGEK